MKLIESPIPMEYNSYVKAYVGLYSQRRRESVSIMLGASHYYFPLFEEILDKYNLPHEFKYLSVVESALNPNAHNHGVELPDYGNLCIIQASITD